MRKPTDPPPKRPRELKALAKPDPGEPAKVTYAIALAMRALKSGTASEHQQQTALEWIVAEAAGKRHFPYHLGDRDTTFALGKLFVAEQIVGLLHVDLATLRRVEDDQVS